MRCWPEHAGSSDRHPPDKPIDTSAYLTPYSDVVAHLVLAHQTQMHNLITQTNYQTRLALYGNRGLPRRHSGRRPRALRKTGRAVGALSAVR